MNSTPPPRRSFLQAILYTPDGRLRVGWRLALQLLLMFILIALFGAVFAPFLVSGIQNAQFFFLGELSSLIPITASVYIARRYLDRRTFASLGLRINQKAVMDLVAGFVITAVIMGLIFLVDRAAGWLNVQGFAWQVRPTSALVGELALMLGAFILTGWSEELLLRGYIFQNLADSLGLAWGALLSAIIFALLHLVNPNASWVAVLGLIAAGLFFVYAYLLTRQLWLPVGLHIGWNFFESTVLGFPVSGITGLPRLIQQTTQGPDLVTGGAFGPEAGLIVLPALLVGMLLIYFYSRIPAKERA